MDELLQDALAVGLHLLLDGAAAVGEHEGVAAAITRVGRAGVRAVAVIDAGEDRRELPSAAAAEVTWVGHGGLVEAVAALASPGDDALAWAAGEHHEMAALRRCLVERHGFARERLQVSAYWKQGAHDHHAHLEG